MINIPNSLIKGRNWFLNDNKLNWNTSQELVHINVVCAVGQCHVKEMKLTRMNSDEGESRRDQREIDPWWTKSDSAFKPWNKSSSKEFKRNQSFRVRLNLKGFRRWGERKVSRTQGCWLNMIIQAPLVRKRSRKYNETGQIYYSWQIQGIDGVQHTVEGKQRK